MESKPDKVWLWSTPRSMSSALFRAMINRPKTKSFMEPNFNAYHLGHKRVCFDGVTPIKENCTYLDIKRQCEAEYPGYDMVFVKDHSFRLSNNMDMIPEGFKHTFILRNPTESISSLYKTVTSLGGHNIDQEVPGYREHYDMFKYVTEELGQEAVIVETRDLLNHPEAMIHLYCDKVGIPFCKKMLNWSTRPEDLEVFQFLRPWFKDLLSENTFRPHKPEFPQKLPEEIQAVIIENMPFYEKLYEHRLKVDA